MRTARERSRVGSPSGRGRMTIALVAAFACSGLAAPRSAAAQEAPSLDRVEAAADSGRVDSARAMLERWYAGRSEGAPPRARSRARFLRARLTADADSAASDYLRVAMGGDARYGDRAWLRLAQLRLAAEEPERALRVLERLRTDYPGTDLAAESWLWTGHAREAAGRPAEACAAWRRSLEAAGSPDRTVRRRARSALGSCTEAERAAAPPPDAAGAGGARADSARGGRAAPADSARSAWAVQLGAFRDRTGAQKLRRAAGEEVPEVDLVIVSPGPEDDLYRVQTRPPSERAAARRLAERFESRQLPAIVVRIRP